MLINIIDDMKKVFEVERTKLLDNSWLDEGKLPENLRLSGEDFESLWETHPKDYAEVMVYGSLIKTPRWQQSYINNYHFSGVCHQATTLPTIMKPYLAYVNSLIKYGKCFNQVLVNWYENGSHYISSHKDDEVQLKPASNIITISFGTERKFRIRKDKKIIKDIMTQDGCILTMGGNFQKNYKHEIVKISGKKGENTGRRISITFRQFKN